MNSDGSARLRRAPFTVLFEGRPFLEFLVRYSWWVLFVYPALIAFTLSHNSPLIEPWLRTTAPISDVLRSFVPVFDNFERELAMKGFGHRVMVIHHILAFGWLVGVPIFVCAVVGIVTAPRARWVDLLMSRPKSFFFLCFLGSGSLFFAAIYWVIFGFQFTSGDPLMSWQSHDLPLVTMGAMFACLTLFGIAFSGSIGAIVIGRRIHS